jgi:asparagine synthase (glutamine-hydrolysing)
MCGIAGILRPEGPPVSRAELLALAARLAHRGPDDEGIFIDGPVGLAHRRLSILDLTSAGRQPLANEDGSVVVVYNGQLYGFEPTRAWLEQRGHRFRSRTDTEVIVHLYEEKGLDLLDDLDGMFAFALWDMRRRRLVIARDRLGIKPLHYLEQGRALAFASETAALRTLPWAPASLDPTAVVHYLYQSSVPRSGPLMQGWHQLGPGHVLVGEDGGWSTRRYWSPPAESPAAESGRAEPFSHAVVTLRERMRAAVRSHLVADVPVGTFLSGGLDSSAVTLEAREAMGAPLHTFSVSFSGDGALDEGPAARRVAEALGTTHHEVVIGPGDLDSFEDWAAGADEPFGVASGFAVHRLARLARQHVKVVLTGDGADEVFAGYPWRHSPEGVANPVALARALAMTALRAMRGSRGTGPALLPQVRARLARLVTDPGARYAEITSAFAPEEIRAIVTPDLADAADRAWACHPVRLAYDGEATRDEVNRRLRADLHTTLVDEMLAKVDRATMAAGLEARVPFLDRALVEWALAQPGSYKVRGGTGKRLVRAALQPALPHTAAAPKRGFSPPLGAWLRGPLRSLVLDTLSPEAVARRGFLRPEVVERLLRAHMAGRAERSRQIFTILALELWLRRLDAGRVLAPPATAGASA